jgi:hypothetical protein
MCLLGSASRCKATKKGCIDGKGTGSVKLSKHDKNWLSLLITGEVYLRSIVSDLEQCLVTAPESKVNDYGRLRKQFTLIWKQIEAVNDRLQDEIKAVFSDNEQYKIHDEAMVITEAMTKGMSHSMLKRIAKQAGINTDHLIEPYIQ